MTAGKKVTLDSEKPNAFSMPPEFSRPLDGWMICRTMGSEMVLLQETCNDG